MAIGLRCVIILPKKEAFSYNHLCRSATMLFADAEICQRRATFGPDLNVKRETLLADIKPELRNVALIVAAGQGLRAGGGLPKQYVPLAGIPMLSRAVDAFMAHPAIHAIYVVIGEGQRAQAEAALGQRTVAGLIMGGANRIDSVRSGLEAIAGDGSAATVFIHDAARPLLPLDVLDRLFAALETAPCVVPVLPVNDTLAHGGDALGDVVERSTLVRVQTPQAARFDAAMTSHQAWNGGVATDDAQMFRAASFVVKTVEGDVMLEKITHADDFAAAEARLGTGLISRTGSGFDVHKLEAGLPLWLCGIAVPHSHGLVGHSDADVALHALTDAIFGAIGAGDIGDHFPPSDPQWKGADSARFLEYARDLVAERGGIIDHTDITIMCEMPKIGPYRAQMRARVAALLRVDPSRISIKATTTERLGFTGRGEGIAAQAVATIRSY
jgi:2-C-methyl-D-erythritol 4-phosphate cytidylyltransferase / 2-C-methyl-D-erythritol 2,4-cyclodiphosphate synthase